MICPKTLKIAHEDIQEKIFAMLPEKWERLYLYASVINHFNKLQTGEMFFFYYPKGLLKKRPVNVYEVPFKFNIDERQYFKLANELYDSIKKLKTIYVENHEKAWTNLTISIENLKYKVEYGYEDLKLQEFDNGARHIVWSYKYLKTPYESFNRREREIIDKYTGTKKIPIETFELPLYKKETKKVLETTRQIEKNLVFVTEEKIKEMEYKKNHIPKSQILNLK